MRILFASANFSQEVVGGAQLSMGLVAEQFAKDGHEVAIVSVEAESATLERRADGISIGRLSPRNVYWHRVSGKSAPARVLWHLIDRFGGIQAAPLADAIRTFRPEVVHTNVLAGLTTAAWGAATKLGIPSVHSVHDYYLVCGNSGMWQDRANCARPCLKCRGLTSRSRAEARAVSGVIYVSKHMRRVHETEGVFSPEAYVTEVMGAYDPGELQPASDSPSRKLRLGYLGRLAPEKGVLELLSTLRRLPADEFSLKVAGAGPASYVDSLKAAAKGLPVEFVGRAEPAAFFRQVDLLVVPSLWSEPAGRVAFEAGLAGVPTVVSARGGLPEVVNFGQRGWVFEPETDGELGELLMRLRAAPAERHAKAAAWQDVAEAFSVRRVADMTLAAYEGAQASFGARPLRPAGSTLVRLPS